MLPIFEDWLYELEKQEEDELMDPTQDGLAKWPFYAQFYNFNQCESLFTLLLLHHFFVGLHWSSFIYPKSK